MCCENAQSKVAAGATLFLAARRSTRAQVPGTELCYWPVGIKVRIKLRLSKVPEIWRWRASLRSLTPCNLTNSGGQELIVCQEVWTRAGRNRLLVPY